MHPQLGSMSEKQKRRLFHLKCIGCVACWLMFSAAAQGGDGHHAEDAAGRAISHSDIIVLCPWHHVGKPTNGESVATHGPSRHMHTVAFTEKFGTDLELLEVVEQLLEKYLATFIIRPDI